MQTRTHRAPALSPKTWLVGPNPQREGVGRTVAPARSVEEVIQFATAGVRLAGGAVTEATKAASRRVANGTSTVEEELAALRRKLLS